MDWTLNRIDVVSGRYRGLLAGGPPEGGEPPALELVVNGSVIGHLEPVRAEGGWRVEGDLGPDLLTQGTRALEVRLPDGTLLDVLTVICGLGAPEDLRAEVEALRAELGVLKAAMRRHLRETSGT